MVAAWTRVAAQMRWVVPEVWRRSTSWFSKPRRCCRTAEGLCAEWAKGSANVVAGAAACGQGGGVGEGGWLSLLCAGAGDGVSLGGRGRGGSRTCPSAGGQSGRSWCSGPLGGGGHVGVPLLGRGVFSRFLLVGCVCASGGSCDPRLAAVSRWEVVSWVSWWGCGS